MHLTPHFLPYLVAALTAVAVSIAAWRRRRVAGAKVLAALTASVALWALANGLEHSGGSLQTMLFWANLEYVSSASIPLLWLAFSLQYTGRDQSLTPRRFASLSLVPAVTVALVWTDPYHGLVRHGFRLDASGPFPVIVKSFGPWFYVHAAYSYVLIGAATTLLIFTLSRSHALFLRQGLLLLVGASLPWAANVSYLLGFSPVRRMDLTPVMFAFSSLLVAFGLVRLHVLDLLPAAREKVIESIADGVLVLDATGRVVDLNPAAAAMLGRRAETAIGPVEGLAAGGMGELARRLRRPAEAAGVIRVSLHGAQYDLDLAPSPLRAPGRASGWVVLMRDVTERRRAEQEREALIAELRRALDRIETLRGLIPICASCKKVRADGGYWQQVEEYVRAHSQAEFTHAICPECIARLYPELADTAATDDATV